VVTKKPTKNIYIYTCECIFKIPTKKIGMHAIQKKNPTTYGMNNMTTVATDWSPTQIDTDH
jgi:hypothetical protein